MENRDEELVKTIRSNFHTSSLDLSHRVEVKFYLAKGTDAMTLSNEPFISIYPTLHQNDRLSLSSFIAHLNLNNKLLTKILNLWTYALNACRQAWWIEIFTQQPKCTYYFGPFAGAEEAHVASKGFVEDLEGEFAQGIKIKIDRHSQPDLLTIEHD
jgi:hypothetical protein